MKRSKRGLRRRYGRSHDSGESFFDAYVTAALWSSNDESDESGGVPLDDNYGPSDIVADTRAEMRSDCARFQKANKTLLREAYARGYSKAQAGHDFWLTRNGHGAGFWDRELGEVGERLTDAAHAMGACEIYFGDDGKIYA